MEQWTNESLSQILDFPVPQDLTQYVLQMQDERDIDECLKSLLDYSNPKHKQFVLEFKKRQGSSSHLDATGRKKQNGNDFLKETVLRKQTDKKKGKLKVKENVQPQESEKVEKREKKKTKFINLYSEDGKDGTTVLLKGRHKCNCEARRHALVNNCTNCGRIVCIQEGSGPCFFCGELVCSPEERTILASNTKRANQLYNKLKCQKPSDGLEDSIKQRDILLENDKNSARCTTVIDDESDYYQSNSAWLSGAEREKLQKLEEEMRSRKHASRLNKKMTFDFAGREIVEENDSLDEYDERQFQELCESIPFCAVGTSNVCPSIEFDRPTYVDESGWQSSVTRTTLPIDPRSRIQDKEYQEISDQGLCLSMHQPYASLLVAGIKTYEGRTWYSSHRGRLWIASAAKIPTPEEISNLENFYRIFKDEKIKFPEHYPTGCLLGCVTVMDVLPQEEYRKVYPDGENDSPYVFVCEDARMLPIKFPIQGKHKIYKLDQKIHQAALKSLGKLLKEQSKE